MGEIRVPGNMSLFKGNTLVILFSFVRNRKVHKTYICFIEKNTSFLLENYYSYEGADPPIHLCTMTMTMNIDLHDVNIPHPIEMKKKNNKLNNLVREYGN